MALRGIRPPGAFSEPETLDPELETSNSILHTPNPKLRLVQSFLEGGGIEADGGVRLVEAVRLAAGLVRGSKMAVREGRRSR